MLLNFYKAYNYKSIRQAISYITLNVIYLHFGKKLGLIVMDELPYIFIRSKWINARVK